MTTAENDVLQAMVDRFNTRADGYGRWWAPVLAATGSRVGCMAAGGMLRAPSGIGSLVLILYTPV